MIFLVYWNSSETLVCSSFDELCCRTQKSFSGVEWIYLDSINIDDDGDDDSDHSDKNEVTMAPFNLWYTMEITQPFLLLLSSRQVPETIN